VAGAVHAAADGKVAAAAAGAPPLPQQQARTG
jgi:hypothetical protein